MEFLQQFFDNSPFPIWSAFLLGLMTAISPCPMATNITAIGYLSKDLENRKLVFQKGAIYTLGRAITYTLLGVLFYFGLVEMSIKGLVQQWGEKLLGPLLIVIGLFMLGVFSVIIPGLGKLSERMSTRENKSFWDVLLLGIVFALAFCPYSGVLFFGVLIPMSVSSATGLYLPLVFALATGLPTLIAAWFIAFSLSNVGRFYQQVKQFEYWFRRVVAWLFIAVGVYFVYLFFVASWLA